MHLTRSLAAAAVLMLSLAPAASAGGAHALVEGPGPDGTTYTVRTFQCANPASVELVVRAEFGQDGRRTVRLPLVKTDRPGVFRFQRTWPAEHRWMLRVSAANQSMPVALVSVDRKGRVTDTRQVFEGDGLEECDAMLRPPGSKGASGKAGAEEGC